MRNWKTSLAGFGAGALTLIADGIDWRHALLAAAVAAIGLAARDHDNHAAGTPTQAPNASGAKGNYGT